jgi:hypothetical protein
MLANTPRKPVAGDRDRRWIADEYFDLIVWYEDDQTIHGFQLCYDKPGRERALTWTRAGGFQHTAIDSGESGRRQPHADPDPRRRVSGAGRAPRVPRPRYLAAARAPRAGAGAHRRVRRPTATT